MNRFAAVTASRTLIVAGIILILSFLVDFVILLFPFQPTNQTWLIDVATAIVDRGIVALVGMGMLFAGYWVGSTDDESRPVVDLRFPALILSSILGLLFLLIFPLHLNNIRQASAVTVERINERAEQQEQQLKTQLTQAQAQLSNPQVKAALETQKEQAKKQVYEILKDEKRYKQTLDNPNTPQALKDLLVKVKANPKELDKLINQQSDPKTQAEQRLNQLRSEKEQAEQQAQQTAWKSGLRIGISSLLLSIGFIIIGWSGLKGTGLTQSSGRKVPAR